MNRIRGTRANSICAAVWYDFAPAIVSSILIIMIVRRDRRAARAMAMKMIGEGLLGGISTSGGGREREGGGRGWQNPTC